MAAAPVILVTAGSAGLGAAASRLFAKHGYRVVVNYNSNSARADQLVSELSGVGNANNDAKDHIALKADLASHEDVKRLVSETHGAMGRIDVIFSNGGWSHFRDVTRLDDNVFDEDWDRAYAMNVKSHLWLLHAAETHLSETEGSFITTASIAGVKGTGSSLVSLLQEIVLRGLLLTFKGVWGDEGGPATYDQGIGLYGWPEDSSQHRFTWLTRDGML